MAKATQAVPDGYHTITPMLAIDDTRKAIDWYKKALGAEELGVFAGPDGAVMHAEIKIGDSRIMLHDVMRGEKGPKDFGGSPASLWIYHNDCDAVFRQAVAAGAQVMMPMEDQFWGDRFGAVTDPFGYVWGIATHKEDLTEGEIKARQEAHFKKLEAARP